MKRINVYAPLLIFCLFTTSCLNIKPYYNREYRNWEQAIKDTSHLDHSVFLIGDVGDPDEKGEGSLNLLKTHLAAADSNSVVLFLGDNVYYKGLPPEGESDRKEMEERLIQQMDAVKDFKGRKIFIPGNHDWDEYGKDGLAAVNRQEAFIENYLGPGTFLPDNGCPGPVELPLGQNAVVIIIDSQWWLHRFEKPRGPENGCYVDDKIDFTLQLKDAIDRNEGKHILIALHHPLYTKGNHSGAFSVKDYFFPLTLIRPNLYIPLPVIGSLYPLARKYGVSTQDLPNPDYQKLKRSILSVIQDKPYITIAAGHEHNLQLIKDEGAYHIVSGAGSKTTYLPRLTNAIFTHQHKGFAKVNYYRNGEAWVEFWEPDNRGREGKLIFKTALYAVEPLTTASLQIKEPFNYADSVITIAPDKEFKASFIREFFWGDHYREVWQTPVTVKYLDMSQEAGGLAPDRLGGGVQTTSLRLKGKNGIEYALRSVNKDPASLLPPGLRRTFVEDILQDQMSSAHPYGPLVIPELSRAIKIYHPEPKLVYVPFTPLLGHYMDDMGGKLAMLEIRPDEDLSHFKEFGYSKNVVSTKTMFEELREDNDTRIDERMYLRSRLFDMLIGDWDRHDDQWRWAEFKMDKGKLYKPVGRDRDQVFSRFDGLIPHLFTRRFGARQLQTFNERFYDIRGLNLASATMDRRLLNSLNKEDWLAIADSVKTILNDEVIDKAVLALPPEVYPISGPEISRNLKLRRDQLSDAARRYYYMVSKNVDLIGTEKHEFFKIERLKNNDTKVTIYKIKKEGNIDKKVFERTFNNQETKELRLYGLEGNDRFEITGSSDKAIKLRMIGGKGEDYLADGSVMGGIKKQALFYDDKSEKTEILQANETRLMISGKGANEGPPAQFKYNRTLPRLNFGYNADEGLTIGTGIHLVRYGFRKDPAKNSHQLMVQYSTLTKASSVRYNAKFYEVFGPGADFALNLQAFGPTFVLNYFGEGNESVIQNEDVDFYRLQLTRLQVNPAADFRPNRLFFLSAGPLYERVEVESKPGHITTSPEFEKSKDIAKTAFGGVLFTGNFTDVDYPRNPSRGSTWENHVSFRKELNGGSDQYINYSSDFNFYVTPVMPFKLTFALRLGGGTNFGTYKFYQSNFLGGNTNLRGYRHTRFAGRSSLYQNTDVRLKINSFRNYAVSGNWGLMGFGDAGRVWADDEGSSKIHFSYGPGIWIDVYDQFLATGYYALSEEGPFLLLRAGFFF